MASPLQALLFQTYHEGAETLHPELFQYPPAALRQVLHAHLIIGSYLRLECIRGINVAGQTELAWPACSDHDVVPHGVGKACPGIGCQRLLQQLLAGTIRLLIVGTNLVLVDLVGYHYLERSPRLLDTGRRQA